MPRLVSREEALARIRAEGGTPHCLMCAVRDRNVGDVHAVLEDDEMLVFLPRYVRRWGQICIMPKQHAVSFGEVDTALWARANLLAHRGAKVVEMVRAPRRCYVASTGSSGGELTQSSQHLHIHVIPLYEPDDKPSSIFSWQEGVYVAERDEWQELRAQYADAWSRTT
jgi:diadenosine tetraphosphate (Ap4A) HIT family hydrolase